MLDNYILTYNLYIYGIRGIDQILIKSYLPDRLQFVKYNNTGSNYNYMKCGVPRGSIISPLLFILYINDLPNILDNFKFVLFDTTLILLNTYILELINNFQFNINKLYDWLNINKVSRIISKTKVLLFNIRNKNCKINLDLNTNNIKVKQVSEIQFEDCKLYWKSQLNWVSIKLSRTIAILYKVENRLNMKYLILLYNVLSLLNYCSNIWGVSSDPVLKICSFKKKSNKMNCYCYCYFYLLESFHPIHELR